MDLGILLHLNKGKGILVLLYLMVSQFATIALARGLGMFPRTSVTVCVGVAFIVAAAWTYFTKDDYYRDREGNKKKMDTVNSFAFIRMKIWAFIFMGAGGLFLGNSVFHYF